MRFAKYAIALAAMLIVLTEARATDMQVPVVQKAIPYTSPNWTGFYVGVDGGYGGVDLRTSSASIASGSGFGVGLRAGYNWQVGTVVVLGVETDFDYVFNNGSLIAFRVPTSDFYLGSVRGRVGLTNLPWSNVMIYADGGFAYGGLTKGPIDVHDGWVAGGGLEYLFTNSWTARLDFSHYELNTNIAGVSAAINAVKGGLAYRF